MKTISIFLLLIYWSIMISAPVMSNELKMGSTNFKNMFKNGLYPKIPDAVNLILCPFAGGSSSSFQNWFNYDFDDINFFLATYPGREHRMRESFATDINQLANDIISNIYNYNFLTF